MCDATFLKTLFYSINSSKYSADVDQVVFPQKAIVMIYFHLHDFGAKISGGTVRGSEK